MYRSSLYTVPSRAPLGFVLALVSGLVLTGVGAIAGAGQPGAKPTDQRASDHTSTKQSETAPEAGPARQDRSAARTGATEQTGSAGKQGSQPVSAQDTQQTTQPLANIVPGNSTGASGASIPAPAPAPPRSLPLSPAELRRSRHHRQPIITRCRCVSPAPCVLPVCVTWRKSCSQSRGLCTSRLSAANSIISSLTRPTYPVGQPAQLSSMQLQSSFPK
jgi:hypothetical protein